MKRGTLDLKETNETADELEQVTENLLTRGQKHFFCDSHSHRLFARCHCYVDFKAPGGDATALIGGTAVFILLVLCIVAHKKRGA